MGPRLKKKEKKKGIYSGTPDQEGPRAKRAGKEKPTPRKLIKGKSGIKSKRKRNDKRGTDQEKGKNN